MRILFTGGGTGGHFFPILAVVRELKNIAEDERVLDLELYYMGPDDFGADLLRSEEVVSVIIASGKMRRYASLLNITDLFKVIAGTLRAIWNMYLIMPDAIFSKGGYGALPAMVAAYLLHIPVLIHESDAVPGRVNRFAARFARRIGIAFVGAEAEFPKGKSVLVGIPIRKRILGGDIRIAKEDLKINSDLPVIAFLGASQGAQKINDAALEILKELTEEYEVLHQTGEKNFEEVRGEASVVLEHGHHDRYHAFGFLDERGMRNLYNAADLIVARAGASTIFEIAAWGKPSILIPLMNAAQDHQRKNAYEYASRGAATVLEEPNLAPHLLLAEIQKVFAKPDAMQRMREAAQKFSRIDSAELIARELLKLAFHSGHIAPAEEKPYLELNK